MTKFLVGLIVAGLAIIYWPAFTSPFFQDDAILLSHAQPKYFLTPVPDFHYHPVANQLFYFFSKSVFGTNVFGFHLVLFLATIGSLVFIYLLMTQLLQTKWRAVLGAVFYAFNISLFALFYWIAVSYFVFVGLFFFAAAYFFLQKGKLAVVVSVACFLLALGSNELAIFLLPLFFGLAWYKNFWPKRLGFLTVLGISSLTLKAFWVGFSQEAEYTLKFGPQVFSTVRWYILRALNLPEGVNRSADYWILIFWISFLVLVAVSVWKYFRQRKINLRLFGLAACWFAFGALPFYFLPQHMSAYYLTISLFGPAVVLAEVFSTRKLAYLAVGVYLLLTIKGLDFLSQTHWIILKNTGPIGKF